MGLFSGNSEPEPVKIMNEEYYEMLEEIDSYKSNVSVSYKSLEDEGFDKGKLKHAEEQLGIITGYPRNILITEKGYNALIQYRVNKAFEAQNEILEDSTELIESQNEMLEESAELNEKMKKHTVRMSRLTKWILGFTIANLALLVVQILIASGTV